MVLLRDRAIRRIFGFIEPCRPTKAVKPPSRPGWGHEVKHDGFGLMVRREGPAGRLLYPGGHDWANRFPAIVEAAKRLRPQSFMIDGEAVICRPDGVSD